MTSRMNLIYSEKHTTPEKNTLNFFVSRLTLLAGDSSLSLTTPDTTKKSRPSGSAEMVSITRWYSGAVPHCRDIVESPRKFVYSGAKNTFSGMQKKRNFNLTCKIL